MFASLASIWPDFQPHYDRLLAKSGQMTLVAHQSPVDFNSFMDLSSNFPFQVASHGELLIP